MKVVKDEFLNALKRVMPGIATGTTVLEGADNLIFHKGNVYTYNSTVSVMTPVGLELEGAVKAVDFYKCLEKLPSDFEIETTGKNWTLKCGKIKVKVNLLNEIENVFDRFEQIIATDKWIDIPENELSNAFSQCYMSKNTTQYQGIFVLNNTVISTDGLQINKYVTKKEYPVMWIPNKAVSEILKWNDFTKVQLNKTWLQFTNGSVVFSVKTLFTENVEKIVEKINNGLNKLDDMKTILSGTFNDEVFTAIERAAAFSESVMNKDAVIVSFEGKDVVISSKRESGEFNESVNIGTEVETPFSFALALNMMEGVSKFYKDFEVKENPNNPPRLVFKNESCIHVVATLKR